MSDPTPTKKGRFARLRSGLGSLRENYRMTRRYHRWVGYEMLGLFILVAAVVATPVGLLLNWPTGILLGLPLGLLAATFWFSRRAMNAAYRGIEGQAGAAAAVVENMRGKWWVTPAVAVSKNQDLVSRVIGKCGVVLVGEGPSSRITHLLANERKKTARWLPETPIYEIQVGVEEDQVNIAKLQSTLTRLPKNLRGSQILDVRRRLEALSARDNPLPIPKGPMPKSAKIPKSMRG
ncbi:MAG: DUF4191 domain-containing protein [Candidatus Nanopelagicales bacterium]